MQNINDKYEDIYFGTNLMEQMNKLPSLSLLYELRPSMAC